jgi:hypothetical protein
MKPAFNFYRGSYRSPAGGKLISSGLWLRYDEIRKLPNLALMKQSGRVNEEPNE